MKSFSKILTTALAAACMVGAVQPAAAKISEAQAARLGADLTPVGAEKAGNKDGTIPAWDGGLTAPPAGWTAAQGYVDPFASDKPLFTITPANADQYKDKLSAGEYAMLKKYPTFQIPVYQTRRTAAYPKQVTDTVKAQATKVELQGFGLKDVGQTTVPFPIPANGMEAIWNHLLRYLGGGLDRTYNSLPVRASGDYYKVGFREYRIFNQNFDQPQDNLLLMFLGYFTAPATLEGTVFLVHEPLDQVKESRSAWIYNAGQRRVRRAPDLTYDNVNDGTEGIRTTDQYDAYNGAPDRYDWKLVGKKEIYVPYNAYKLADKKLKYADMAKPKHLRPDLIRHELHRVWVVEAKLKAGSKHVYGRRTFYLDEDSWSVLIEDAYDTRGQLWRVSINPLIQFYDAGVPWYAANIYHDLNNGSYLAGALQNEIKTPWVFGAKGKIADFQPDALRRAGTK